MIIIIIIIIIMIIIIIIMIIITIIIIIIIILITWPHRSSHSSTELQWPPPGSTSRTRELAALASWGANRRNGEDDWTSFTGEDDWTGCKVRGGQLVTKT